jgi:flagellar biosynthesis chaperone FliJ
VSPSRYPLAAVLEQRGALREQARCALAESLHALGERERELARSEAAREAILAEVDEVTRHLYDPDETGLLPIPVIERRTEGLKNLERSLQEAEQVLEQRRRAVAEAQAEAGRCRERLVEADRDLKAAEKHHEAWRAERLRERARKDQRQSEEVTLARFAAEGGREDGSGQGGRT